MFFYSVAFCEVSHPGQIIFLANGGIGGGLTGGSGRFVEKEEGGRREDTKCSLHESRTLSRCDRRVCVCVLYVGKRRRGDE